MSVVNRLAGLAGQILSSVHMKHSRPVTELRFQLLFMW